MKRQRLAQKLGKIRHHVLCEEQIQTELIHVTGTDDHLAGSSHPERWLDSLPNDRLIWS